MEDRSYQIMRSDLVAAALWLLAVVVLAVGTGLDSLLIVAWGLAASAAAATATARAFLVRFHRLLRETFEMGQESERLRRVR